MSESGAARWLDQAFASETSGKQIGLVWSYSNTLETKGLSEG
jgi:hypothetical protein